MQSIQYPALDDLKVQHTEQAPLRRRTQLWKSGGY